MHNNVFPFEKKINLRHRRLTVFEVVKGWLYVCEYTDSETGRFVFKDDFYNLQDNSHPNDMYIIHIKTHFTVQTHMRYTYKNTFYSANSYAYHRMLTWLCSFILQVNII